MWIRGIAGAVLCLVGAVWIAQGTNALGGSGMSGHGQWAVIGVVLVLIGLALLVWAWRVGGGRSKKT
jgi:protein-S-isoprenylcysteine O-methyltransferase Ste14